MEDNNEVQPTLTIDGIEIGLIKLDPVAVKKAADGLLELNQAAVYLGLALNNCFLQETKYNTRFKKHVQELTRTCIYDYNTVYRVCSIFGIKKAKDILNTCFNEHIQYLLSQFIYFPGRMTAFEEEVARAKLKYVDEKLPERFEQLLESSEYNSETLYQVFMSHGSGAKEIVEYAIENELMPHQLLKHSDTKLDESTEESFKKFRFYLKKNMGKEEKLPKKLRNGW